MITGQQARFLASSSSIEPSSVSTMTPSTSRSPNRVTPSLISGKGARLEAAVDASGDRVLQAALAGDVEIGPPALQVVVRGLVDRVLVQVEHGGAGVDPDRVQDEGGDRGGLRAGGRRERGPAGGRCPTRSGRSGP